MDVTVPIVKLLSKGSIEELVHKVVLQSRMLDRKRLRNILSIAIQVVLIQKLSIVMRDFKFQHAIDTRN